MIVILPCVQIPGIQVQARNIWPLRLKVGLGRTKRAAAKACGELTDQGSKMMGGLNLISTQGNGRIGTGSLDLGGFKPSTFQFRAS